MLHSGNSRVATTAIVCVLAALAAGTRNLETTPAPTAAAHQNIADVRIVDPAFCRDQTWPYIDQRCLKRAQPQQTASTQSDNTSAPMNIAPHAANMVPRDITPSAPAAGQNAQSPIAAETPASSPQPVPAESSAASSALTDPATDYSTTQTALMDDSPAIKPAPKPHHTRHHSRFFFGFHF
jgi:hypothetical protein